MSENNERLILNCTICEEKALHVMGDNVGTQQCINCGYVSSDNFIIEDGEENPKSDAFKSLNEDMLSWSIKKKDRMWVPSIMTLPFGTIYPRNEFGKMKWAFAEMVDIPKEEQENYPDSNGGYFTKKYDVENAWLFDSFIQAISHVNEIFKKNQVVEDGK